MIKAKTNMIEPTSEAAESEVFVVADNIIPVRVASVDTILNTEFTEEMQVVPEKQVQQLIIENKTTNPLSGFFVRMGGYLDSMENFLSEMHSNYMNAIEQKKSIYQTEETDQDQRTNRSKRTARKLSDERRSNLPKPFGDLGDDILGLIALNALGGGIDEAMNMGGGEIQIVPYTPVAGQLVAKGKTDPTQGAKGYVSGYPLTSLYGWRWGRMHGGVDIGVPVGTKFALKEDAVIKFVGWEDPNDATKGYGLLVDAWVPSIKKMFRFGHLSSVAVKDGETIKAGSVLGASGNTGRSTGPHFHIEVHNQVTSTYGGDDPMPYIDYVIAGEEVQQRSEGSIERVGRVMVGEAGTEFVIPMSQMPIFADLMMEEKIKSLNPYYISDHEVIDDIGFERKSGFSQNMMGEGGIVKGIEWIKEEEGISSLVPGRNKYVKPSWPEYKNVTDNTVFHAYETGVSGDRTTLGWGFTFLDEITSGRKKVTPGMTMTKKEADDLLEYQVRHYHDNFLDTKYFPKFKYFTPEQQAGVILYGFNQPYFWYSAPDFSKAIEEGNLREASEQNNRGLPTREKIEKMLLRSGPLQIVGPKIVGPKKVGPGKVGSGIPGVPDLTIKKMFQSFGKQSSLNTIPGNEQMRFASETQEQFSFDNVKGEIVALYQPTVYYTET